MATQRWRTGTVTAFDDASGLGQVTDQDGTTFGFHCTAIADGTRTIERATSVRFEVVAGRVGNFEAHGLTPV